MNGVGIHAGTDFWRGSQFVREGEASGLNEEDSRQASHVVSVFAETVDEAEEADSPASSLGEVLRQKFMQASSPRLSKVYIHRKPKCF